MKSALPAMLALPALLMMLAGCERQMRNMYVQPKLRPLQGSTLWKDGRASRPLPPDTVPQSAGALAGTSSGRLQVFPAASATPRPPLSMALLTRGRERFDIYCAPCHGLAGHGDGIVAQRGFPHPPSYHIDRLRDAPDSHLFDVITHGYGAMYPYASRVDVADRWAIVSYIRALQLSQSATLDVVPAARRADLK
jgi:mono/diheme cytochrome c family protein